MTQEEYFEKFKTKYHKILRKQKPQLANHFCTDIIADPEGNKQYVKINFLRRFYPHQSGIACIVLSIQHITFLRDLLNHHFSIDDYPIQKIPDHPITYKNMAKMLEEDYDDRTRS